MPFVIHLLLRNYHTLILIYFYITMFRFRIFIIFVFLVLISSQSAEAANSSFPKPMGYINDFASVIEPGVRNAMEVIAQELAGKTGAEVVVVTITTTGGMDYNEYADRLYETWGIGQKGRDEGVLILNAVKDRIPRIEVGCGLKSLIPDGAADQIRDEMIPFIKKGNHSEGLNRGFTIVVGIIAEDKGVSLTETMPVQTRQTRSVKRSISLIGILLLLLFLFFLFGSRRVRTMVFPPVFLGGLGHGSSRGFGGGFHGGFRGGFSGFGRWG